MKGNDGRTHGLPQVAHVYSFPPHTADLECSVDVATVRLVYKLDGAYDPEYRRAASSA